MLPSIDEAVGQGICMTCPKPCPNHTVCPSDARVYGMGLTEFPAVWMIMQIRNFADRKLDAMSETLGSNILSVLNSHPRRAVKVTRLMDEIIIEVI